MLVTVSQLEVLELLYNLDYVIMPPLINTFCSVTEDSLLGVSYLYFFGAWYSKLCSKLIVKSGTS